MKQRILVMNGQRLIQTYHDNQEWKTDKVERAPGLKPGIYNIYLAKVVEDNHKQAQNEFSGVVIHVNNTAVIQQIGKDFIMHDRKKFTKVPTIGDNVAIQYGEDTKVSVAKFVQKTVSRKRTL